jgi:hypothetical protein
MDTKTFILVLSMWGNDGVDDHYIGQMILQEPMSEKQCHWMIEEDRWTAFYANKYYKLAMHCFPEDCAGKKSCD